MQDAHVPDAFRRRRVEAIAEFGLAEVDIAKVLDIPRRCGRITAASCRGSDQATPGWPSAVRDHSRLV